MYWRLCPAIFESVTPTINDDGFITLKIKPEVSSVIRTLTTSEGNAIPIVNTSEAETTAMVKDGTTVIIAGLREDTTIMVDKRIPFFGDIPILGRLFRSGSETIERDEIVKLGRILAEVADVIIALEPGDGVREEVAKFADRRKLREKLFSLLPRRFMRTARSSYSGAVRKEVEKHYYTPEEMELCGLATKICPKHVRSRQIERALD